MLPDRDTSAFYPDPTLMRIAALIERLGASRDCQWDSMDDDADALVWRRRCNAERASRVLLQRLLNPAASTQGTPGAIVKGVIEELLFLVHVSTPAYEPRVQVTVHYRHIVATETERYTMMLTALELVLHAIEDGAVDVALTLEDETDALLMQCISQHPQLSLAQSAFRLLPEAMMVSTRGPWAVQQRGADQVQVDVRVAKHSEAL